MDLKVIALYLPQFYPFPENDEWWGKGFTEWTNVGKAHPLFKGHYQPRVPADLGYYDLRLPIVREQQAELAREAGITGFCYWHYWFGNGKRLMWEVFDEVLKTGRPDFPFCLGWANHSWYAKNWNISDTKGADKLLIKQNYFGESDYRMHFDYVVQAFRDPRYIKIDGRPIFHIYDAHALPKDFIQFWGKWAREEGFKDGIYFIATGWYNEDENDYIRRGYSAVIKSRLRCYYKQNIYTNIWGHLKNYAKEHLYKGFPNLAYYEDVIDSLVDSEDDAKETVIPTIVPNFDHSPRSGRFGLIYHESTPELFAKHVSKALSVTANKANKIVWLKSWNEWGEGNYMEPDMKYGKQYIEILRNCIDEYEKSNV